MKRSLLGMMFIFSSSVFANAEDFTRDEEKMQEKMMDKTKQAIMSYEIVEDKTEELLTRVRESAFGEYAEKAAIAIPFVTGKVQFKVNEFDISYNHFSERAKIDYRIDEQWKLFYNHQENGDGSDDRSGLLYSSKF